MSPISCTHRPFHVALAAAALLAGCTDGGPTAPDAAVRAVSLESQATEGSALATLRRATARYHDVNTAIADGFILLHGCETRPGEGAVGVLYVHLDRFLDGVIDPASPDGLLYEETPNGKLRLTGVELAIPAAMWAGADPPAFLGVTFQAEEEFGALGLHIWLWKQNPQGMFAQAHPGISCGAEAES